MDRFRQDLQFALRGFRRSPAFVATVVAILALGIGMSVATFTVFRTVLVRRLPVIDQDRIAVMWTYRYDPLVDYAVGTKELAVVRRESRTMRDIAAVAHWPATDSPFRDGDRSLELKRGMATGNFFDVLGVRPALGRLLRLSDDEIPGSTAGGLPVSRALVLSYRAWREKFGGDSSVIGRHLVEPLLRTDYTIIGVAPSGFDYPAGADYWIPMWEGWQSTVSAFAVARLAPGATLAAARDEYFLIEQRVSPGAGFRGAHAATFTEIVLGDVTPALRLLAAAVALLLCIACINVGSLLLLRVSGRAREIAIRCALGAAYGDIVRQLLVEAGTLALCGGALGFGLGVGLLRMLVAFAPANLPRIDDIQLAGAPIVAAVSITVIAVVLFGVAPALLAGRANLASPLRQDSRSGGETRRRRSIRQTLVASQVALAMVMLAGAGLLARSLARLEHQDGGYDSDHLSVFWFSWNAKRIDSTSKLAALGDRVTKRIRAIPGITAATPLVAPPMLGNGIWQIRFEIEGQVAKDAQGNPAFAAELVGPEFFATFGASLTRGRVFDDDDRSTAPLVAIVSEAVARRIWPGENAIGKRIRIAGAKPESIVGADGWRTVVGVARETHLRTIRESSPTVYLPSGQSYWQGSVAVRSTMGLTSLLPALRAAGHDVDPELEVWDLRTMDDIRAEPLAQPRLNAFLMSSFGSVALILAAIGLYGVMASLVRDQVREIGIRIALGASSARVRRDVLGRALIVTGGGALVGLIGALATSRLLTSLLFQIAPTDPTALGGAFVTLFAVGALAAYLPARRATQIDPVEALRAD